MVMLIWVKMLVVTSSMLESGIDTWEANRAGKLFADGIVTARRRTPGQRLESSRARARAEDLEMRSGREVKMVADCRGEAVVVVE